MAYCKKQIWEETYRGIYPGADEKTVLKREKELQKVKDKIMSEQGAPKKVMSPFCMRCDFHVGDVIAYPLDEQKTNYAVFVVVALHHQISRITALSQDRLYVCFHDALFDHLPSKDECQSLRYMELAADAQDRIKRFVRELYLPNKSAAARFFANCTKISYRHDVFESVDEREDIILNVKTFEETLPRICLSRFLVFLYDVDTFYDNLVFLRHSFDYFCNSALVSTCNNFYLITFFDFH